MNWPGKMPLHNEKDYQAMPEAGKMIITIAELEWISRTTVHKKEKLQMTRRRGSKARMTEEDERSLGWSR